MLSTMQITQTVISAAMEVHRRLGPGCSDALYEQFLQHELHIRGVQCRRPAMPHGGHARFDLIAGDAVAIEIAAAADLRPAHQAQLAAVVRQRGLKNGLLISFLGPVFQHRSVRRNR
jgi:GxxExxY protein